MNSWARKYRVLRVYFSQKYGINITKANITLSSSASVIIYQDLWHRHPDRDLDIMYFPELESNPGRGLKFI